MKVTLEGQVTIPPDIRARFGLLPGREVEFISQGDAVAIRPVESAGSEGARCRFQRWLEGARGSATGGPTTDQMMAITRGED